MALMRVNQSLKQLSVVCMFALRTHVHVDALLVGICAVLQCMCNVLYYVYMCVVSRQWV